jgi:hypothetical protein
MLTAINNNDISLKNTLRNLVTSAVSAGGNHGDNVSVIALKVSSNNKISYKFYLLIFVIILVSILGWKVWGSIINSY